MRWCRTPLRVLSPAVLVPALMAGLLVGVPAPLAEDVEDLALGVPVTGALGSTGDVRYYRVPVTAGQHVFALLEKDGPFSTYLDIKEGAIPTRSRSATTSDDACELTVQADGYVYARVESNDATGGGYSVVVHDPTTFPTLEPGESATGEHLSWEGDAKWYQIPCKTEEPVFGVLDKTSRWYSRLALAEGSLPSTSQASQTDQATSVTPNAVGFCYARVELDNQYTSDPDNGTFALSAYDTSKFPTLSPGQSSGTKNLEWVGDRLYYQIPVVAGQHVFALLDKTSRWYSRLALAEGGLPSGDKAAQEDQGADLVASAPGFCYVSVELDTYYSSDPTTGALGLTAHDTGTFPTLDPGESATGEQLSWEGDAKWYQIPCKTEEPVFGVLDKTSRWYSRLALAEGSLPSTSQASQTDQATSVTPNAVGFCYARVELDNQYTSDPDNGTFALSAYDTSTFPTLSPGQPLTGQHLSWNGDCRWYQVVLPQGGPLVCRVTKSGSWGAELRVKQGGLPDSQPYSSSSGTGDLEVAFVAPSAATYYLQLLSTSDGGTASVLATDDLTSARGTVVIDNDDIRAAVSIPRACVTSLVFKRGSNAELVADDWGSYLMDLGSTSAGAALRTGWVADTANAQANAVSFGFRHGSGFRNTLSLTWGTDGVHVTSDFECPESRVLYQVLAPGGGWEADRDKWAYPTADRVETGSYTYPGGGTPLYPPDGLCGSPSEGWIAFWDDSVDEAYGFTFTGGVKALIANGVGADEDLELPAGQSRAAFHVVKPKPATPYEAVRPLVQGPYLSLAKTVDKATATAGDTLTYTLAYRNTGTEAATNASVVDQLPLEVELVPGSITGGGTYDATGRTVTWPIASVPPQSTPGTVGFAASVGSGYPGGRRVVNRASVSASETPAPSAAAALTILDPTDLALNQAADVALTSADAATYRLTLASASDLFIALQQHETAWNTTVRLLQGGQEVKKSTGSGDQLVHVTAAAAGEYLLEVGSTAAGNVTLWAGTHLPELPLGQWQVRTVYHKWGEDWTQVTVLEGTSSLVFDVEIIGLYSTLDVYPNEIGGSEKWHADGQPMHLVIANPAAGTYYARVSDSATVEASSQVRDYMIRASTSDAPAQPVVVNNDTIRMEVWPDRACVASLVCKKGSNQELVDGRDGRYLLDPGGGETGPGAYLKTGWTPASQSVGADHAEFRFTHASGYGSRISAWWSDQRVQVRSDFDCPESLTIASDLLPGGRAAAGDGWAVPESSGVANGTFLFPGTFAQRYPSASGEYASVADGWLSLWSQAANEVCGFTFSPGCQVQVGDARSARIGLQLPAGQSTVAFEVGHPKPAAPAEPYELIRGLTQLPVLSLNLTADQRFTSPGVAITYSAACANAGTTPASGAVLQAALPTELAYVDGSATGATYDAATRALRWTVGDLAAGAAPDALTFKVTVAGGTAEGTAFATAARLQSAAGERPVRSNAEVKVATPALTGVSPDKGGNAGSVTVTLTGHWLDPSSTVLLRREGAADAAATSVRGNADGTELTALLDLTALSAAAYTVVVKAPGGAEAVLADGFQVAQGGGPSYWAEIRGREIVRLGRRASFEVRFGNSGDVDAPITYLALWFPRDLELTYEFEDLSGSMGPADLPAGYTEDWRGLFLGVRNVPPGGASSVRLSVAVRGDLWLHAVAHGSLPATALDGRALTRSAAAARGTAVQGASLRTVQGVFYGDLYEGRVVDPTTGRTERRVEHAVVRFPDRDLAFVQSLDQQPDGKRTLISGTSSEIQRYCEDRGLVRASGTGYMADKASIGLYADFLSAKVGMKWLDCESPYKVVGPSGDLVAGDCIGVFEWAAEACGVFGPEGLFPDADEAAPTMYEGDLFAERFGIRGDQRGAAQVFGLGNAQYAASAGTGPGVEHASTAVTSVSPEDKYGPAGYDPPGTEAANARRCVRGGDALNYRIDFWNKEDAPAPTQDVYIEDQLDPDLDPSTFEFGEFGFLKWNAPVEAGTRTLDATVDLRPDMSLKVHVTGSVNTEGKVVWELHALDPYTNEPPEDPQAGFLPPITDSGYEIGWVNYSVKPKAGLPTGTQITNQALVKFDLGPWKPAPPNPDSEIPGLGPWLNTIDSGAPSSQVTSATQGASAGSLQVQWTGQDDEGGSGAGHYDVYVSDNGGAYTLWQEDTTATSATYSGTFGHTYGFYSVATDNVGNTEAAPTDPDVSVLAGPLLSLPAGLSMVSIPVVPEQADPKQVVGFPENAWATWDPAKGEAGDYAYYPDAVTQFGPTSPGRAFWVRMGAAAQVPVAGQVPDATQPFAIALKKGWNLVGNPRTYPVTWDLAALQVRVNGQTRPLAEAADTLGAYAWLWQPPAEGAQTGSYALLFDASAIPGIPSELPVWGGCWMNALQDCELLIPAQAAASATSARKRHAGLWGVRILARGPATEAEVSIGQTAGAKPMSVGVPPGSPGEKAARCLSLLSSGTPLAVEIRQGGKSTETFDLVARPSANQALTLSWPDMRAMPRDLSMTLIDVQTNTRTSMRTASTYVIQGDRDGTERKLQVVVQKGELDPLAITGLTAEATRGAGCRVSFRLTKAAHTSARVLNAAGRVVAQPETMEARTAGANTLEWNGRNTAGTVVPPGTYLVQLEAVDDEQQRTRAVRTVNLR